MLACISHVVSKITVRNQPIVYDQKLDVVAFNGISYPVPCNLTSQNFLRSLAVNRSGKSVAIDTGSAKYILQRIVKAGGVNEKGIYGSEDDKVVLFTGEFDGDSEEVMIEDPYLSMCFLSPLLIDNVIDVSEFSWRALVEMVGPFIITEENLIGYLPISVCGFTLEYDTQTIDPPLDAISDVIKRRVVSPDTRHIIRGIDHAFHGSVDVDVAFLRCYRVFELNWASHIKEKITTSSIEDVLKEIKSLKKFEELLVLKDIFARKNVVITGFSKQDFYDLFSSGHSPTKESYSELQKWLKARNMAMNAKLSAEIVYYVRNALVHAKIEDGEPYLMGPLSGLEVAALKKLTTELYTALKRLI
jgi:hypothetical protein